MAELVKITEAEIPFHHWSKPLKVTSMGNVTEVQMCSYRGKPQIKVIENKRYIVLATGEVKEFIQGETRQDNQRSLKRTFKKLREIINTNATEPQNCRWCTLTYAENMTDTKRLYTDFEKFNKRFLYWNTKQGNSKPEYISVIEPQGRGAWHCHVLYIWNEKAPYIANTEFAKIWGHGFVNVQQLKNVDNIGAYLTAYLADIPVTDPNAVGAVGELKDVDGKKYIKGGRLRLYPSGTNLYRTSRTIKKADVKYISPDKLDMCILGGLTYQRTIKLKYPDGQETFIDTKYYNRKK